MSVLQGDLLIPLYNKVVVFNNVKYIYRSVFTTDVVPPISKPASNLGRLGWYSASALMCS